MLLHSLTICNENKSVVIYVTDTIDVVVDKINSVFGIDIKIEYYSDCCEIELDQLPLYDDINTSLRLKFTLSGELIAIQEADYFSEEDVAVLNCVDDISNGIDIDFISSTMCEIAQEHITLQDTEDDDNAMYLSRGIIESPVGDWVFAYLDMEEPFTTLTLVKKSHEKSVPYEINNIDLLTDKPDSNMVIYFVGEKE